MLCPLSAPRRLLAPSRRPPRRVNLTGAGRIRRRAGGRRPDLHHPPCAESAAAALADSAAGRGPAVRHQ
eukprot:525090-Prorocentrum_minimum.AAC.2